MNKVAIVFSFFLLVSPLNGRTGPLSIPSSDSCDYAPECSIEYDFSEKYLSTVPGAVSYSFSCDSYRAGGSLHMENGDSICVEQVACHHFGWNAVLVTEREVEDYRKVILEFASMFDYHMNLSLIESTVNGLAPITSIPLGINSEIRVVDPNDYLQDFYIVLSTDSRGRNVIRISYYGG